MENPLNLRRKKVRVGGYGVPRIYSTSCVCRAAPRRVAQREFHYAMTNGSDSNGIVSLLVIVRPAAGEVWRMCGRAEVLHFHL